MRQGLLLLLGTVLCACAQVREISGGVKDDLPPVLVEAEPPMGSVRFNGQRIVLTFDERIQLDRPRDRLLVSPPLAAAPVVRLTGAREVTIELTAPLDEATTYTFGVGEAIKDLTEGNIATGLTYVLSTGDALDSLQLTGEVRHAFTGIAEKDVLVMLYRAEDTTTVHGSRPAYATRTDRNGVYRSTHLRPGAYRIHALRDQNANYRYDLPNEEIAFLDSPVQPAPPDSIAVVPTLYLFQPESPVQALREARVSADGAFRLILAKPAQEIDLRDIDRIGGMLKWTAEWGSQRDTVMVWPSDTTALAAGRYEVRCDGLTLDTLRYRPMEKMPFNTGSRITVLDTGSVTIIQVEASRPIREIDMERIRLIVDSLSIPLARRADFQDLRRVRLSGELPAGANAMLTILPKGIQDIYGGWNDTLRASVGRPAEGSTGTLRVSLTAAPIGEGNYRIHLLDAQGRKVREAVAGDGEVVWDRLAPGNHTLMLIHDRDGDRQWDTGDLRTARQPERVWRHPEVVNVRAGWDLKLEWKLE